METITPNSIEKITQIAQALPHRAHQVAVALAAAYGHLWGNTWAAQAILAADHMDADTLAELLARAQALCEDHNATERPTGIELADAIAEAPATGPYYRHTTGSGRLVWEIRPEIGDDGLPSSTDWLLDLEIWRPAVRIGEQEWVEGQCIMARYTPEKGWELWHDGIGAPFYDRHVESLKEALNAVRAETEPFPQEKLEELERAANGHVLSSARSLAEDFVQRFGLEAAKGVEALFSELGEQASNVRRWHNWPSR